MKASLKGIENLEIYSDNSKASRKVMTLPLLRILGHEVSKSPWSENSKRVFWTVCCMAFFGSFRLGELLPFRENYYCPEDSFLWEDVRVLQADHVLVHIKTPKGAKKGGDFVDLFPVPFAGLCPVAALRGLKSSVNPSGKSLVFQFSSGKCLTPRTFTSTVQTLLAVHIGESSKEISSHSFRAAIPSALAKFPELTSSNEIMGWGRWKSEAYLCYTRLKQDQREKIFSKIITSLSL